MVKERFIEKGSKWQARRNQDDTEGSLGPAAVVGVKAAGHQNQQRDNIFVLYFTLDLNIFKN